MLNCWLGELPNPQRPAEEAETSIDVVTHGGQRARAALAEPTGPPAGDIREPAEQAGSKVAALVGQRRAVLDDALDARMRRKSGVPHETREELAMIWRP